jgi:hypothetical protein
VPFLFFPLHARVAGGAKAPPPRASARYLE